MKREAVRPEVRVQIGTTVLPDEAVAALRMTVSDMLHRLTTDMEYRESLGPDGAPWLDHHIGSLRALKRLLTDTPAAPRTTRPSCRNPRRRSEARRVR